MLDLNYDLENVANLSKLMAVQREKIERLRELVRTLKFIPLDPAGSYHPVTFRAFDGGLFNMHFDPFEFDIVEVADSDGNLKLKFAAPSGDFDDKDTLKSIIGDLNSNPIIKNFLDILGKDSLDEISEILTNKGSLMEIGEFACIFNKIASASPDERTIILKDGLLRTKKIKAELIDRLRKELCFLIMRHTDTRLCDSVYVTASPPVLLLSGPVLQTGTPPLACHIRCQLPCQSDGCTATPCRISRS